METEQLVIVGIPEPQPSGMPQLDFATYPNQIFWLVVALVVTYLVLSRIALPRISSILAERQNTISADIAAAEDYKAKAHDAEAAYEKALSDARAQAQSIIGEMQTDLKAQIDAATAKADAEIQVRSVESEAKISEIKANALETVLSVATDTAAEVVSTFGGKVDVAAVEAAVAARVKG